MHMNQPHPTSSDGRICKATVSFHQYSALDIGELVRHESISGQSETMSRMTSQQADSLPGGVCDLTIIMTTAATSLLNSYRLMKHTGGDGGDALM
jgi:hypothetical protein